MESKRTYIIAAISLLVIAAAIYFLFIFQKSQSDIETSESPNEVKEATELEIDKKPYVTLTPTSDGAEIVISIENMNYFDKIEYELTYLADNPQVAGQKLQRGATGTDVNPADAKYKKSMLLGTASRGVRSTDKGIADGKLALHLFKDDIEYLSETDWNLLELTTSKTELADKKGNLTLSLDGFSKNYWVIVADTVGIPQAGSPFDVKKATLPAYGVFSIAPKFAPSELSIKIETEVENPILYSFISQDEKWEKLERQYDQDSKTVSATISNFATFVVVSQ